MSPSLMTLFATVDPRPIHFMGIAGAGMRGLALLARQQGAAITGCDNDPSGAADLAALGVEIWRGHDPGHLASARALVVTAAVAGDHPELERARALGIPVVRRADALGQAVAGGIVVAVAGTHGKTTTTVMVTEALAAAGRNPTGLAGGRVAWWGGNARLGGRDLYVVEADEFDRAFLALAPTVAVVNNVEADHLECYGGSTRALEQAFVEFASRARRVIAGADDAGALRVAAAVSGPGWRGGLAAAADGRLLPPQVRGRGPRAQLGAPGGRGVGGGPRRSVGRGGGGCGGSPPISWRGARRGRERRPWRCGTAPRWWSAWRSGCGRGTWCSRWARATSPASVRSCCSSSSRGTREGGMSGDPMAALAAACAAWPDRRRALRPRPGRDSTGAATPRAVPRAADRARGGEAPGAGRRDRGAAIVARRERVHRYAAVERPAARARGSGGGGSRAAASGVGPGRAAPGWGSPPRPRARARRPPGGGRCGRPGAAVRPRAHGARPPGRRGRGPRGRRRVGAGPVGGSRAVSGDHQRARFGARGRGAGTRAPPRPAGTRRPARGHSGRGAGPAG